jgi:hypothetical protein
MQDANEMKIHNALQELMDDLSGDKPLQPVVIPSADHVPAIAHTRVDAIVEQYPHLQQAVTVEPRLRTVLLIAADPEPRENRWISYEACKRLAERLVGWYAENDAIRTSSHYDAFIEVIDALLPQASSRDGRDDEWLLSSPDEEVL